MFRRQFCTFFAAIPGITVIPFLAKTEKEEFDPEPQPGDAQYGWYDTAKFHCRNETYWRERALCAERDLEQREETIEKALKDYVAVDFPDIGIRQCFYVKPGREDASEFIDHLYYVLKDGQRPHSHEHCLNGSHNEI